MAGKEGTADVTKAEPRTRCWGGHKGDVDTWLRRGWVVEGELKHNGGVVLFSDGGNAADVEGEEGYDRVTVRSSGDPIKVLSASIRAGHKPMRARREAKEGWVQRLIAGRSCWGAGFMAEEVCPGVNGVSEE